MMLSPKMKIERFLKSPAVEIDDTVLCVREKNSKKEQIGCRDNTDTQVLEMILENAALKCMNKLPGVDFTNPIHLGTMVMQL